ncbi:hypothetical protein KUTeg_011886 [Tegillarca granosa]|uniref:Uncharacterized protein n=1 Tax=Tegillarca granosa TaxID=220873 RepID=A0ABQ9F0E0_TEGGR|nr:hypothetical protein KUTeg_011886 [Tegillarca granosa]
MKNKRLFLIKLVIPEICVTALTDRFKYLPRTEILYAIACILFYFLGFPTMAQGNVGNVEKGGMYYFALLEYYVNFVSSVSLLFFEIIAVSWIYVLIQIGLLNKCLFKIWIKSVKSTNISARRLAMNILEMTGSAPHLFIIICWYIISPLLIIHHKFIFVFLRVLKLIETKAIWVFSFVKYSPFTYGSYVYPTWAVIVAWIIASLPLICIPIGMFHAFYKTPSITIMQVQLFFEYLLLTFK